MSGEGDAVLDRVDRLVARAEAERETLDLEDWAVLHEVERALEDLHDAVWLADALGG